MAVTFAPTLDDLRRELQRHERALFAIELRERPWMRVGDPDAPTDYEFIAKRDVILRGLNRARLALAEAEADLPADRDEVA
jgi:hypothetical protein